MRVEGLGVRGFRGVRGAPEPGVPKDSPLPTCQHPTRLQIEHTHTHTHTHQHTHTQTHTHTNTHKHTQIVTFCFLGLRWSSPESGDLWYTKRRFAPHSPRAGGTGTRLFQLRFSVPHSPRCGACACTTSHVAHTLYLDPVRIGFG